jgi:hypothetical protein
MDNEKIIISNIWGGISPSKYYSSSGQFLSSLGIDPDMPITDNASEQNGSACGFIRPNRLASAGSLTAAATWFDTEPKTGKTYIHTRDGKFYTITSAFNDLSSSLGTLTASTGNGMAYYDNYIYFRTNDDILRYGPLNGSPTLTDNWWTTTLSLTAPSNTTYPSILGVPLPNGQMLRHNDGLYFCDVGADNKGILNFIRTKKTTVEGDTNDGSAYNVLDFNYGQWPMCLEGYGTMIAIGLYEGGVRNAQLTFWDTVASTDQNRIAVGMKDPMITALKNVNGVLYVFSGNYNSASRLDTYTRVSVYAGGYSLREVAFIEGEPPPFPGAVDHLINRLAWGSAKNISLIGNSHSGCVYALGYRNSKLGTGLQNIFYVNEAIGAVITAFKYINYLPLIAYRQTQVNPAESWGLSYQGGSYGTDGHYSSLITDIQKINKDFSIKEIRFGVYPAITTNMRIVVTAYKDDFVSSVEFPYIDNTNNSGYKNIKICPSGDKTVSGKNDFALSFSFQGTALMVVKLPIEIIIEVEN